MRGPPAIPSTGAPSLAMLADAGIPSGTDPPGLEIGRANSAWKAPVDFLHQGGPWVKLSPPSCCGSIRAPRWEQTVAAWRHIRSVAYSGGVLDRMPPGLYGWLKEP